LVEEPADIKGRKVGMTEVKRLILVAHLILIGGIWQMDSA